MQTLFIKQAFFCLVLATQMATTPLFAGADCEPDDASDALWETVYQVEGTRIIQPREGHAALWQATALLNWDVEPEALYRRIWAYENFAGSIPRVEKSVVLKAAGDRRWIYQQLDFPAPLRDRHYVLESTNEHSIPAQHIYQVAWRLSQRFPLPARERYVTVNAFTGCWNIRQQRYGGLNAIYSISLDPGGWIPHWMARAGIRQYLIELMQALRSQLQTTATGSE